MEQAGGQGDSGADCADADPAVTISQDDAIVFSRLLPATTAMSKLDKVAGMLAYAHYALQKHQFIEQWIKERGGPPSQENLRAIILSFRNENSVALDSLKQQSKTLLREYSEEHADAAGHAAIVESIRCEVKKRTRFWVNVGASMTAALLYSLLIALVIFTATAAMPETKYAQIVRILFDLEEPSPALEGVK